MKGEVESGKEKVQNARTTAATSVVQICTCSGHILTRPDPTPEHKQYKFTHCKSEFLS